MARKGTRKGTRKMRGGKAGMALAQSSADYTSSPNAEGANTWVESRYGNVNQQYNSVFDQGSSQTLGNTFTTLPASQTPSPDSLKLIQSAGGKRRRRKAGMVGEAIGTAAVPLGLLYLNQKYGKKRKTRKMSYKKRGGKKRRGSRKSKRGGTFGAMLSKAAVPFTLLGLNHKYGKKKRGTKKRRGTKRR